MTTSNNIIAFKWFGLLLIIGINSNVYAQNLQRFFMLEEERIMLDEATDMQLKEHPSEIVNAGVDIADEVEPFVVTLTGFVIRNNYQHTVWLNGYALSVSELPPGLLLDSSTATLIQVKPNHGGVTSIAIGEKLIIIDPKYIKAFKQKLAIDVHNITVGSGVESDSIETSVDDLVLDESVES